ncbi:MAG: two-component system response regulator [Caulobacteraceae bacterium]|nr:two-component system response regulator [Caulobacteraceae bacterium]
MAEPLAPLRILVVDDNPQMRTIMGAVLTAAGVIDLHTAPDGRAGLEKLAEQPFDCIYTDFEMPVMNGIEFVRRVRASTAAARYMPIIMLTGYSELAHIKLARDAGVTEFLRKPVTARDILLRLEAVIMKPRPFVTSREYFGPDRRRIKPPNYSGPRRRSKDRRDPVQL